MKKINLEKMETIEGGDDNCNRTMGLIVGIGLAATFSGAFPVGLVLLGTAAALEALGGCA